MSTSRPITASSVRVASTSARSVSDAKRIEISTPSATSPDTTGTTRMRPPRSAAAGAWRVGCHAASAIRPVAAGQIVSVSEPWEYVPVAYA